MKKIFLLIPALVLALVANAATTNVSAGEGTLPTAISNATSGDVLVLTTGEYTASSSVGISKNLIIKAADGESPVIKIKFGIQGGARVEFQGVKFDASVATSHLIYANDATAGNQLILEGCELYGFTPNSSLIHCSKTDDKLDVCTINNCYFHDIKKSCLFVENTGEIDVTVTNSTFANITTDAGSYYAGVIDVRGTSGSFLVDHCTFYDVQAMSTDYAAVGKVGLSSGAVVSNCIFALSTSGASSNRTIRDKVAANNCLVYNYTADSGYGMQSNVTKTGCIKDKDPKFAAAGSGDFTLDGESPAIDAGTDGKTLGDPRWWPTPVVVPVPGTLLPGTAKRSSLAEIDKTGTVDTLLFTARGSEGYASDADYTVAGSQYVKWNISVAKSGKYIFTANTRNFSGHNYRIIILNEDETSTIYTTQEAANNTYSWAKQTGEEDLQFSTEAVELSVGSYVVKVQNRKDSKGRLMSVEAEYLGGALIDLPATLMPIDALRSEYAKLYIGSGVGEVDTLTFAPKDKEWYAVDETYSVAGSQYVKWNINVVKAGKYKFTANTYCKQGHNYRILLLNQDESVTIHSQQEKEGTGSDYHNEGADWQVSTDVLDLPVGQYVLKIQGKSYGRVMSVEAEYLGGALIDIPATLFPIDALRSDYAFINDDGEFRFTDDSHDGHVTDQWGKWNIHVSKEGFYSFTLNANSDNSHHYQLFVLNPDESQVTTPYTLDGSSGTELTATTEKLELAEGDYIIKITNTTNNSHGRVIKIIANYEGGAIIEIPANQLLGEEAILEKTELGTKTMIRLENGDIKSSNNSQPSTEYAIWNVSATEIGMMQVTLNLDPVTSSGHNYRVELYDGNTLKDYSEELESDALDAAVHSKGDVALTKKLVIPAVGDYTIKLINRTQWSSMILKGITLTPAYITLDEGATSNSVISDAVSAGGSTDVKLTRTLTGGMYNTICLPFAVSADELNRVFGEGNVKKLSSSTLAGDVLDIALEEVTSMEAGKPYLVKPAANIVDPKFFNVEVTASTPVEVKEGPTTFKGTFIKSEIPASENNLFLGPNNTLYFPEVTAQPIKGLRGWFEVVVPGGVQSIKHARIVEQENKETAVDLIESENNKAQKVFVNGQLLIVKDGVQYNTVGIRVK